MHRRTFLFAGGALLPGVGFAQVPQETPSPKTPAKSLVIILLAGGLSHIDTFDPKSQAVAAVAGEFRSIATQVPGIHFSEMLPKLAGCSKLFTLLRGVSHGVGIHDPAQRLFLTGSSNPRPSTPSLGSIVSQQMPVQGNVPTYAAIPALPPNAGELGQLHEPFNLLGDSGNLLALAPSIANANAWQEFQHRRNLLKTLESHSPISRNTLASSQHSKAYQRAFSAIEAEQLRGVTALQSEELKALEQYGVTDLGKYLLYARKLIEMGTRCITVQHVGWDTHTQGFTTLKKMLPELDQALSGFFQDLDNRNLLDSTMVAVLTEFGRTPHVNAQSGRDHWPQAGTAILAGGPFKRGLTFGETDELGQRATIQGSTPHDIACTLLELMEIPTRTTRVPPTGRVLLPEGRFLHEIVEL